MKQREEEKGEGGQGGGGVRLVGKAGCVPRRRWISKESAKFRDFRSAFGSCWSPGCATATAKRSGAKMLKDLLTGARSNPRMKKFHSWSLGSCCRILPGFR